MIIIRICIILAVLSVCAASGAAVSEDSARLEGLRKAVENNPTTENELQYIENFPATFERFRQIFYGKNLDELYSVHNEHLILLRRLSEKYPKKVLAVWLGVATNGRWDADAIGILQKQLATYGVEHTKEFVASIKSRPKDQRLSIIRFLADKENHPAYTEYHVIMNNLQVLGYNDLYKLFLAAKKERMKRRDH